MSRRKDMDRFLSRKQQNQDYVGFRGAGIAAATPVPMALESVACSGCNRKRNVDINTLPEDRSTFICKTCQEAE